jgi:hypothetical protein
MNHVLNLPHLTGGQLHTNHLSRWWRIIRAGAFGRWFRWVFRGINGARRSRWFEINLAV